MRHVEDTDSYEFTIKAEKDRPVVSSVTEWKTKKSWVDFRQAKEIFLFSKGSRPAPGLNQPLMIGVLRVKRSRRETDHSPTI